MDKHYFLLHVFDYFHSLVAKTVLGVCLLYWTLKDKSKTALFTDPVHTA